MSGNQWDGSAPVEAIILRPGHAALAGVRPGKAPLIRAMSVVMAAVVAVTIGLPHAALASPARAEEPLSGCEEVMRALRLAEAQPRIHVRSEFVQGRHPGAIRLRETWLIDDRQWMALDGVSYGAHALANDPRARAEAAELSALIPASPCQPVAPDDPVTRAGLRALRFEVAGEYRWPAAVLWIDPRTGLPKAAEIDGPELFYSRDTNRPTKAPRLRLVPTGRRLVQQLRFDFGPAVQAPQR